MSTTALAPTDRQVSFYNTLATERGLPTIDAFADGTTRRQASDAIDALMALPRQQAQRPRQERQGNGDAAFANVPDGHYALPRTGDLAALPGDDAVVFFKVNTGKYGKWQGFRFLDRESGGNHEPVKDRRVKAAVMRDIAADVLGAATRYGREVGRCGMCRIKLTDDDSRAMGIGPDCFEKVTGRRRVKADVQPYLPGGAGAEAPAPAPAEDTAEGAAALVALADTGDRDAQAIVGGGHPVPLHVLARMGAEQISGMEMNRDTGEFDRPLRPAPQPQRDEVAAALAHSARVAAKYEARIPVAIAEGHPAERIESAIGGDERLAPADKERLLGLVATAVERRFDGAIAQGDRDDTVAAAIAKAYAEGDTALGKRLEREAGPEYAARRRQQFGF